MSKLITRRSLLIAAPAIIAAASPALAQFNGCPPGFCSPGASGVSPASLSGLVGMWDASNFASLGLSGAAVQSVADGSGGGHTMLPVGSGNKTQYGAANFNTNYPSIVFTGTDLCGLGVNPFPMGTGNTATIWYVGTLGEALSATSGRFWSYSDLVHDDFNFAGNFTAGTSNPVDVTAFVWNRNSIALSANATGTPVGHIIIVTVASSGAQTLYIDGTPIVTSSSPGNWTNNGSLSLGRDSFTDSSYVSMHMGEFGIATSFSDATLAGQMYLFLKAKWGL